MSGSPWLQAVYGHAELEVHISCDTRKPVAHCHCRHYTVHGLRKRNRGVLLRRYYPAAICRTETTGCNAWQQPCTRLETVCSAVDDPNALPTGITLAASSQSGAQ